MTTIYCDRCKKACQGDVLKVLERYYHHECFRCALCATYLGIDGYYESNREIYCKKDYSRVMSQICATCGSCISGDIVTVMNKYFHKACFYCHICKIHFKPGMRVTYWNNQFLCKDCFNDSNLCESQLEKNSHGKNIFSRKDESKQNSRRGKNEYLEEKFASRVTPQTMHLDVSRAFCRELSERLAAQYTASLEHIVDGTNRYEKKEPGSKYQTHNIQTKDTLGTGKGDVAMLRESITLKSMDSPDNKPIQVPDSNTSYSPIPPKGRVAELVKALEKLPYKTDLQSLDSAASYESTYSSKEATGSYHSQSHLSIEPDSGISNHDSLLSNQMRSQDMFSQGFSEVQETDSGVHDDTHSHVGSSNQTKEMSKSNPPVCGRYKDTGFKLKNTQKLPPVGIPIAPLIPKPIELTGIRQAPVQRAWLPVRPVTHTQHFLKNIYRPTPVIGITPPSVDSSVDGSYRNPPDSKSPDYEFHQDSLPKPQFSSSPKELRENGKLAVSANSISTITIKERDSRISNSMNDLSEGPKCNHKGTDKSANKKLTQKQNGLKNYTKSVFRHPRYHLIKRRLFSRNSPMDSKQEMGDSAGRYRSISIVVLKFIGSTVFVIGLIGLLSWMAQWQTPWDLHDGLSLWFTNYNEKLAAYSELGL